MVINSNQNFEKEIITDVTKLNDRCDEIDVRKENDLLKEIVLSLKATLRAAKTGVGLAANQIGYDKRVFVINFNNDLRSFVNPIISEMKGFELSREQCMSLPGKEFIRPRYTQITVLYQTPLGKSESRKLLGKAAIVFQHELDHLDGLLLSDIGLEIDENFDKATEEERIEIIKMYMDSLDMKQKEVQKEISDDPELQEVDKGIKFMEALQKGEVTLENKKEK